MKYLVPVARVSARARDVLMRLGEVNGVKYLNDSTSGRGLIVQKAQHIAHLVNTARAEEPGSVSSMNGAPIIGLVGISRQIVFDEAKLVASGQIPEHLSEAAEKKTPSLGPAQTGSRIPELQHDAHQLGGISPRRANPTFPREQSLDDLQKKVIERLFGYIHSGP